MAMQSRPSPPGHSHRIMRLTVQRRRPRDQRQGDVARSSGERGDVTHDEHARTDIPAREWTDGAHGVGGMLMVTACARRGIGSAGANGERSGMARGHAGARGGRVGSAPGAGARGRGQGERPRSGSQSAPRPAAEGDRGGCARGPSGQRVSPSARRTSGTARNGLRLMAPEADPRSWRIASRAARRRRSSRARWRTGTPGQRRYARGPGASEETDAGAAAADDARTCVALRDDIRTEAGCASPGTRRTGPGGLSRALAADERRITRSRPWPHCRTARPRTHGQASSRKQVRGRPDRHRSRKHGSRLPDHGSTIPPRRPAPPGAVRVQAASPSCRAPRTVIPAATTP